MFLLKMGHNGEWEITHEFRESDRIPGVPDNIATQTEIMTLLPIVQELAQIFQVRYGELQAALKRGLKRAGAEEKLLRDARKIVRTVKKTQKQRGRNA